MSKANANTITGAATTTGTLSAAAAATATPIPAPGKPRKLKYRSHARSISSRVVIGFRIDPGLKLSLHKKMRQRRMRSLSDLMETVVREWLDRQDGHATPTSATIKAKEKS